MKAKSRYQPSKIVEALFKTAVVKIKADADKAIAKQDATSETEVVSAKAGLEAKAEAAEQKTEDVGTAFEDVAEKKVEITAESQEPVAGEVYKAIQQMTHPQPNQLRDDLLVASALCAKDIMEKNIIWARPDDSVHQVLAKMQQADASYTMIGSDGVLEGIVSKSDLAGAVSIYLRPIFAKWRRPLDDATLQIRIKWIMTRPVYIIRPQTPLAVIVRNMSRFRVCALPVVSGSGATAWKTGLVSTKTIS